MLLRLMLLAALAVAFVGCGHGGNSPEVATTGVPASNIVSPAPTPQQTDTRPAVVAFGDSLSAGFGLDPGKSFPDDLQRLIDKAGYRYHVVNMGVSGDTTTDGVERLPSVVALKPAVVILEFGGNDGLRGQPVSSAKQNMAKMIEALQSSGAQVVIAGMTLPRNYGPEYIHSFEQMYVELAKQYRLVRIPFLLDGVGGVDHLMQPDGLHPTAQGAEIVAQTVMRYLQQVLRR
ncbi:MAG TPA: arylesterase [Bryobacteraceae bacterium]|nr:arylesterase [Bryobacteraceae bacterium]